MISYVIGDATKPDLQKLDLDSALIVHGCNDLGAWGAGFVLALNNTFGDGPRKTYMEMPKHGGAYSVWRHSDAIAVANLITQQGVAYGGNSRPVQYDWIHDGLALLGAHFPDVGFVMPRIGSGLGGGDWNIIEAIVNSVLKNREVFVHDLEKQ